MSLNDKIIDGKLVLGDDISKLFVKHVKQTIQDFTKELKEVLKNIDENLDAEIAPKEGIYEYLLKEIDRLNQKHYGDKLIKEKLKSSSLGKPIGVGVDSKESSAPALRREIKGEKRKWKK